MSVTSKTGRRKTSVARVYLSAGNGKVEINHSPLKKYFKSDIHQIVAMQALTLLNVKDEYDLTVNVAGGGGTGQAEAVRLGTARALVEISEEYKAALKKEGLLTRDSRMVERKKYGRRKARKKFQFSKR